MKKQINLTRNSFSKTQYPKVIDTEFSQLTPQVTEPIAVQDVSVDEFFVLYDKLFFDIPQRGNNSHETLITTSTEYIGYNPLTTEIEALQQEITELRRQLLDERGSALNTIADVLDTAGLDLPELPTLPDLEIPSEFSVDVNVNVDQGEEQTRREKRQERRAKRKEERQKRRDERRNN
jgi:HAMP domain-containing protein